MAETPREAATPRAGLKPRRTLAVAAAGTMLVLVAFTVPLPTVPD
jgi:hypothetical protein